jgi:type IV pilus assembly protein PilQ
MASIPTSRKGRALVLMFILMMAPGTARTETIQVTGENPQFSMEFRDADIKDVLRALGQTANLNIIISDTVTGHVTMSLKNVDLWAALESILKTKGLTYVRDANMIRVVSLAEARDIDMETRVFPLGNASSKDILPIIEKIKSEKAKVFIDNRTNAVVVKDLSLNIDQMARLLKDLDIKMPQVLIEAKIIEVSTNYAKDLGIQWGGRYAGTSGNGSTVISGGTTGVSSSGTAGGSTIPAVGTTTLFPLLGDVGISGNAYAVNLPAAVVSGGGALGISFGRVGGNALDLQLSAMQTTGNGRILSNPRVITANNHEAKISSGIEIPLQVLTTTTQGTSLQVQTINANLMLSATPTIGKDNRITLAIKLEKSEPDFSQQVNNIPTINTENADTELVVNDGETVVLGGIITKNESKSESAVPFLSKIPLIGWLFKRDTTSNTEDELMIFITPKIMRD